MARSLNRPRSFATPSTESRAPSLCAGCLSQMSPEHTCDSINYLFMFLDIPGWKPVLVNFESAGSRAGFGFSGLCLQASPDPASRTQ